MMMTHQHDLDGGHGSHSSMDDPHQHQMMGGQANVYSIPTIPTIATITAVAPPVVVTSSTTTTYNTLLSGHNNGMAMTHMDGSMTPSHDVVHPVGHEGQSQYNHTMFVSSQYPGIMQMYHAAHPSVFYLYGNAPSHSVVPAVTDDLIRVGWLLVNLHRYGITFIKYSNRRWCKCSTSQTSRSIVQSS
jgi:hypothetical protein